MSNPFATDAMAAGYARSRPPVHPRVLERTGLRASRALDVGCGAGISTRALNVIADRAVGMEPAEGMLRFAPAVAPGAVFVVGSAEALPLRDASFDLITAAGALNYVDLDRFFPEARRVLAPAGSLLVYDFSAGRSFPGSPALDRWFDVFTRRYPFPPSEARSLDPDILAGLDSGFAIDRAKRFDLALTLAPAFYLDYMLTETNVAAAVRRGVPLDEIRSWCAASLAPVWQGCEREVLFRGYWAAMKKGQAEACPVQ
jgi:SAM-dependent methyltransferase